MATFTQLASGNWRVQVRRKTRYVAETFRRRKDGEEWALEMERNIDRNGSVNRSGSSGMKPPKTALKLPRYCRRKPLKSGR